MPIERSPIKDEPEHRINDENAIGPGMSSPFAEARKPLTNPLCFIWHSCPPLIASDFVPILARMAW
jgi:hypothetical protein